MECVIGTLVCNHITQYRAEFADVLPDPMPVELHAPLSLVGPKILCGNDSHTSVPKPMSTRTHPGGRLPPTPRISDAESQLGPTIIDSASYYASPLVV